MSEWSSRSSGDEYSLRGHRVAPYDKQQNGMASLLNGQQEDSIAFVQHSGRRKPGAWTSVIHGKHLDQVCKVPLRSATTSVGPIDAVDTTCVHADFTIHSLPHLLV